MIYHGVTVTDPYRWLENGTDPRVQQWSAAQDQRARAYLDALPYRQPIYDRLYQQISATSRVLLFRARRGGKVFALYNQPPKNQPMIAVLDRKRRPGPCAHRGRSQHAQSQGYDGH